MRAETKERADTITGSVLRGSFTFYQATAGDMGRGREMETEREREAAGKKKHVRFFGSQTSFRSDTISLVELNLRGWSLDGFLSG